MVLKLYCRYYMIGINCLLRKPNKSKGPRQIEKKRKNTENNYFGNPVVKC